MLVNPDGHFITQRQQSSLCLISTEIIGHRLCFAAPSQNDLSIDMAPPTGSMRRTVEVWGDRLTAQDCGDEAAAWFSDFLATECRLVMMPEDCQRLVDADYAINKAADRDRVSFADGFPILLISESSVADLNQRLPFTIHHHRFRPNVVISGAAAFAEDQWQHIRIGEVEFSVVKPCSRCVIPSIDPATGDKQPEVTRTLAGYRRREGVVYFGQNVIHHRNGAIRLGDQLEVLG